MTKVIQLKIKWCLIDVIINKGNNTRLKANSINVENNKTGYSTSCLDIQLDLSNTVDMVINNTST